MVVFQTLSRLVDESPPPYAVRGPHTRGRPPADPRDVARFLLIRALEGWSFDTTFAHLTAIPGLPHLLGFRRVPHASTVIGHVDRIPPSYWQGLVQQLNLRLGRTFRAPWNIAGDSTGAAMREYLRWRDQRHGSSRHRDFVKLHALVVTRAQGPWFAAVHATPSNVTDVTELGELLAQLPAEIPLGNVTLDKGYQSRRNAQLIVDRGGRPVMDLKASVLGARHSYPKGHTAWKMALRERRDRRRFRCRYRRRTIIEGVFGAFKARFGAKVRCKVFEHQVAEMLARTVVWDALAVVYHEA
ncbi:MAG: transposase [Euryarchaeota archaeon]|nr:transposase [Euryarchaeota archaeon]MDE2046317.1 transposase [Thermoplasmata archaeon]